MKYLVLFPMLAALLVPLVTQAETVSIDPPADPVVVGNPAIVTRLTSSPNSVSAGQTVTYTLGLSNPGSEVLTNLTATFDLPVGFTFANDTRPPALQKLGSLAPGASKEVSFRLTVAAAPIGRIPLEVLVSGTNVAPMETTSIVTVQASRVLGAENILAETGTGWLMVVTAGAAVALAGVLSGRRLVRSRRLIGRS